MYRNQLPVFISWRKLGRFSVDFGNLKASPLRVRCITEKRRRKAMETWSAGMMKVQQPWLHQLFSSPGLLRRRLQFLVLNARGVIFARIFVFELVMFLMGWSQQEETKKRAGRLWFPSDVQTVPRFQRLWTGSRSLSPCVDTHTSATAVDPASDQELAFSYSW